ncbi:OmpA family protein [Vibrio palustris]|uniref:Peptidoglycan-binding protein ArfA n=1 Tax=Vibrio palustris TaxID=1918946 RepID=A0A1R4B1K9_9VIBR|nr:OmpA family protein [Vibrio palustris]SJL82800.1 Peptidoglycan-binding protein ArfA [Vibrio palustris]
MKLPLIIALVASSLSLSATAQATSMYAYLCQRHNNVEAYTLNTADHGKTLVMYAGDRAQTPAMDSQADIAWIKAHVSADQLPSDCVSYFLSQGYWQNTQNIARFHFEFDSAKMSATDKQILSRLVTALESVPKVSIVGHTDSMGSKAYNAQLGAQRATTVSARIANKTQNVAMLTSSKGQTQPIAANNTSYGRKLNRRVEIILNDNATN